MVLVLHNLTEQNLNSAENRKRNQNFVLCTYTMPFIQCRGKNRIFLTGNVRTKLHTGS